MFQRPGPVQQRLHRDYEEIRSMLFAAYILELQPSDWHEAFKAQEMARLTSEPGELEQQLASVGIPPQARLRHLRAVLPHPWRYDSVRV